MCVYMYICISADPRLGVTRLWECLVSEGVPSYLPVELWICLNPNESRPIPSHTVFSTLGSQNPLFACLGPPFSQSFLWIDFWSFWGVENGPKIDQKTSQIHVCV